MNKNIEHKEVEITDIELELKLYDSFIKNQNSNTERSETLRGKCL